MRVLQKTFDEMKEMTAEEIEKYNDHLDYIDYCAKRDDFLILSLILSVLCWVLSFPMALLLRIIGKKPIWYMLETLFYENKYGDDYSKYDPYDP